ncbi:hydroxymethylglutaryl-CoA lyase [Roseivirga sp. E12]|uniref:hydroxymethylglutaryl-CoA lyase n=1 Tax=Roseivirga sp. E12 TaxID=2819237 RepID=UPI001ABCF437|nr:hydroxymethylglutaryl-CoA lyase [Roseivirga sp. E12]MBO3697553.1 hydroxymethylglutaryl-CoA lyase [Roseivirga sp. E12]
MKIIECPRDAMQGLHEFIPTEKKALYINQLLKVGFDTIDFGSFVSPKAIPQLRDTAEVLDQLNLSDTPTKLLAIIANVRGAEQAIQFEEIDYLGFPLSISEQFQLRNTNKSIQEALQTVADIQNLCVKHNKELVAYISMGFGNPYGEPFNEEIVAEFVEKLTALGIGIISLSDTIGVAEPDVIENVFGRSISAYPSTEFGAHFHSTPDKTLEKLEAAYAAGCRRFDTAIKGFGGCPMAKDDLTGNIATERLLSYMHSISQETGLDKQAFDQAMLMSLDVFPQN